ncbi:MAG TPA: hypothetical protein VK454_12930 [Myxococcaceae bacterium]|nr:hypothetical protein [Myxococcaceae bacterium]
MAADRFDFVLRLLERLDDVTARLARVEGDVSELRRLARAMADTVDQLASSVSEVRGAWRTLADVVREYTEGSDAWRARTDEPLDRLEAAIVPPR